jgi:hypothetical protein
MNLLGLGEGRDLLDPRQQALVLGGGSGSVVIGLLAPSWLARGIFNTWWA